MFDRVMVHSVAPWADTGYGRQAAQLALGLSSLGVEVAISAFSGLGGSSMDWNGITVFPGGSHPYGADVLPKHAKFFKPQLTITLCDPWALGPIPMMGLPVACWVPLDSSPMSRADQIAIKRGGAKTIAMSRFGEKMLRDAGHHPVYAPHGIDSDVYKPADETPEELRKQLGFGGRFVVGMVAANNDERRKGWWEQLSAFARLYRNHDDAVLIAHTDPKRKGGLDLRAIVKDLGIEQAVKFTDNDAAMRGDVTDEQMARTYSAMHLFSNCALAEGFGLPMAEAQLCGVPTVATNGSAMADVCGGWLVDGQEIHHGGHKARWVCPSIDGIVKVYEKAYQRGGPYHAMAGRARDHALQFDAATVLKQHWVPALERLEASL